MKALRLTLALVIGAAAFAQSPITGVQPGAARAQQVLEHLGQLPLTIEPNQGQAPQGIDFVAPAFNHRFLLSSAKTTLELFDVKGKPAEHVDLELVGANPAAHGEETEPLAFRSSYFSAQDPDGLLRNLRNYSRVRYQQVWPGVDVIYYGNREKLEYDMVVAPGADPGSIRIRLTGQAGFFLNATGDLVLQTHYGTVTHHRPLAYQIVDRQRTRVQANYKLVAGDEVRIQLGEYDRSRELVIDPTLTISSPTLINPVTAIGVDGSGNIYTASATGQGNVLITAFSSTGAPLNQGTIFADTATAMAVSSTGKVYVTGSTSSTRFFTTGAFQPTLSDPDGTATDAYFLQYVALPSQAVQYSTFLGGLGTDSGNGVTIDGSGNAYITGQTVGGAGFSHTVGPATIAGGGTDAFVAKINPTVGGAPSLIYSRFLGGAGADSGNGIAVDVSGNAYVGGATTSTSASFQPSSATGFNTSKTSATNDGFIVKLNPTGASALYLTFLPLAPINGIAVDTSSAAYVTGAVDGTTNALATTASAFQLTNGGNGCANFSVATCTDAFLSKYNTTVGGAPSLVYSTYLGGTLSDAGLAVAADNSGNAYLVGRTNSSNFPVVRPLTGLSTYQGATIVDGPTLSSQFDAFAAKINTNDLGQPSVVYSTYLGGTDTDQAASITIDSFGNVFVGGTTASSDFPNLSGAPSAGGTHGFFVEIGDPTGNVPVLSITKTHSGNFFKGQANATYTVTIANAGSGVTSGTITVTETAPSGLALVSMSGTGWSCPTLPTCTRSDALVGGGTYPTITVTVNVNGNATSPQVNQVGVSGGGSAAANVSDSTTILNPPLLSIAKTHSGSFTQGQFNAVYTVTVSNAAGSVPTSGTVTVTETLPGGLALVSMAGTGWACVTTTCTRSDALAAGASYPAITVTVNVAGNATSPQNNQVGVTGGGSVAANANDSTTILPGSQPALSISKTHSGNFTQGQQNATYTVTVSNNNGAATTSGTVTVTETIPSGLTLVAMAGTGWSCPSNTCTRSDALAGGASYPAITVTVNVSGNATSPKVNQVSVSGGGSGPANASDSTVINLNNPTLSINRTRLNFGYSGSLITSPQTVTVNITGGLAVGWTAASDRSNITVSPTSGTGSGTFQVTATAPAGGLGGNGIITVTAAGATGSPQQIQVFVTSVTPTLPSGSFDTPNNNTTGIAGAVAVTGWALDTIEVVSVGIWREPVPNEATSPNGLVFIGNANFVADARPDVQNAFPTQPYQYRAGWGYLMLTTGIPNSTGSGPSGNGTYKLHIILTNAAGQTLDLGAHTITLDNAHATKPFGTIDTPSQGGNASGSSFVNFGWALTQNPKCIAIDGSTITVTVDGVTLGNPAYNNFRADIAGSFPGLCNSNGAIGFFVIDTTKLTNGVHTIGWLAFDNTGSGDGLGSRFFNVFNAGGGMIASPPEEPPTADSLSGGVRRRNGLELAAPD